MAAYVSRKYLEYLLTGQWGRTINVEDPRIRRETNRRNFDAVINGDVVASATAGSAGGAAFIMTLNVSN